MKRTSSQNRVEGVTAALLSPLFTGIATVLASQGTRELTPMFFFVATSAISVAILWAYLRLRGQSISIEKIKKSKSSLVKATLLRGIFGNILVMFGLSITTGIVAVFVTKMEPYFILLINWVTGRESISMRHLGLLSIHLAGAFLLITGGFIAGGGNLFGDALIITAVALFALSYLPGKKLANEIGAVQSNMITYGIGAIAALPLAVLLLSNSNFGVSQSGWIYVLLYLLLRNVLGMTLWWTAIKNTKAWLVSALRAIGPLVSAPFAFLVFGQVLNPIQIIGAAVVLTTSFILSSEHIRKK